ncbi:type VII secretion protein EssC [Metabacillus arenae]|uniref:Type VII secretion protein EssC n=1 Tax=Metabacillus arenae TaxID=2771434 RepID=A0A926RWC2_9BACI|nr:type VII secretion protein EssC [Metabacillus arenae]MBD1379771.1 type VII secretion protein EssC [Metabacillus arenae]
MSLLWVFYGQSYQQYEFDYQSFRPFSLGKENQQTITISDFPFTQESLSFTKHNEEDGLIIWKKDTNLGTLTTEKPFQLTENNQTMHFYLTPSSQNSETFYTGHRRELNFSTKDSSADVFIDSSSEFLSSNESFTLLNINNHWFVSPMSQNIYLNGKKVEAETEVKVGDILFWPFMTIQFIEDDLMQLASKDEYQTALSKTERPTSEMKKKYPVYRRTPRMIYDLPKEKVSLSFPSQEAEDHNRGLWMIILPPLVMLMVMGIVALVAPRGIFIIISMVMFGMTLITSTVQFFKEKGNYKRRKERRQRVYTVYLENKRQELQELADKQKQVLYHHFPSFERMKYLTEQISDRIWERTLESTDLLQLRIGTGKVPSSYQVSISSGDMANREIDDLLEQSQLMEKVYREVGPVPINVDLSVGAMGLIGKPSIVKKEIHQLIGQLAFFHSYHDVRFVFIFNEKEYSKWEWVKWLPHFQLPHAYAKGLIYNEQTRDQLLSSIYEILRDRDLAEQEDKVRHTPHIVFIITDYQLLSDHVILEYLEGESSHLGISVIFAAETKESLSENIHTLVRYVNDLEGDILIQEKKAVQIPFKLDEHHYKGNEEYARMLRTLDHQVGITNSIPQSVSFLELFHAKEVDDLPIEQNWLTRESSKSLSVPIGLKGKTDLVELNLHEKAHGPHGLLAGTTGSGKSEFLQTYILSLAVHFHPHEVAFLLIDYKGGGMAQPFKDIPHLLGTITNIEGSKNFSNRALASIKSELKRRQRLFDRFQVNHINDYTKLYKQNKTDEPLPHLFLISDEFAELKSEEPDFIRELVSAARIGRSLGVHLILATQKPGGVIDDQIWSNARFKVALKVQDAADSREIIKNSDAASITVTGRGYLQVGNNEVYELFQSAWSGAPYMEETQEAEDEVAIVTDLGLVPLSDISAETGHKKDVESEIEVVVNKIEEIQQTMGIKKLNSPWLPPLASRMSRFTYTTENDHEILLGLIDEPEKQSQTPYSYQLMADGNIGIFGSSGYGKSQTVMTLLLSIATKFSPEEAHYYLFDFGNGSLLPLKQLPHTADFFLIDEERKTEKFIRILKDEIAYRKQLFQQAEVSSIKMYNSLSEKKLPLLFITIDNFDLVKEEMQDMEMQMTQFARDGQSLGIYMILTATRINSIRQSLMNNLKTKVVHYLMDNSESYMVLGKVSFAPEPIPGRAIIKRDQAFFSQVFMASEGKDDYELHEQMKEDIQDLVVKYKGISKPKQVPMLPSELTMINFTQYAEESNQPGIIPIGLDEELVQPVSINLPKNKHCLVLGQSQKGKTNVLKVVLNTLLTQDIEEIGIFDSIDRGLSSFATEEKAAYMETKDQIVSWLDSVEAAFNRREQAYLEAVAQGSVHTLAFKQILLVIDGYSRFLQTIDTMIQERMTRFMKNYSHLGFHLVISGNNNELTKGFDSFTSEIKQIRQALILMKKSEQTLYTLSYNRKEEEIHPGFGYYVENGKETKIQIPLCAIERKIYS